MRSASLTTHLFIFMYIYSKHVTQCSEFFKCANRNSEQVIATALINSFKMMTRGFQGNNEIIPCISNPMGKHCWLSDKMPVVTMLTTTCIIQTKIQSEHRAEQFRVLQQLWDSNTQPSGHSIRPSVKPLRLCY